jgi:hypothetical protein
MSASTAEHSNFRLKAIGAMRQGMISLVIEEPTPRSDESTHIALEGGA